MDMQIDRKVTWGNIISWVLIGCGLVAGYAKLESATQQNTKDVAAAVLLAQRVEESTRAMDARRDSQINSLTVDVAVTKVTVASIDKKLDELMRRKANE
jgi:saccharopine dehydrogenase-like NADP-dependent oxidoreductase